MPDDLTELDLFVLRAKDVLGLEDDVDVDALLELARDVAHGVKRAAAPVSTYLLGIAVGRGADPGTAAALLRGAAEA